MGRDENARANRYCPKCQGRLHERELKSSGIRIDACPSCRGMWFDWGELEKHLDLAGRDFTSPADAKASARPCPLCEIAMSTFKCRGTDVAIDLCEECGGVWLDMGELRRLEPGPEPEAGGFLGFLGRVFKELTSW